MTNERSAWELLSLVDQIHLWAITEFRTFVTKHLKSWHMFCDENYLLDWKSVYDVKPELKHARGAEDGTGLPLPGWAKLLNESAQQKVQARAQKSLAEANEKRRRQKGKGKEKSDCKILWQCKVDECWGSPTMYSSDEYFIHL